LSQLADSQGTARGNINNNNKKNIYIYKKIKSFIKTIKNLLSNFDFSSSNDQKKTAIRQDEIGNVRIK